jgi:hypothetical protein
MTYTQKERLRMLDCLLVSYGSIGREMRGRNAEPASGQFPLRKTMTPPEGFSEAWDRSNAEEAAEREGWRSPQGYTGDKCENCGRNRVLKCNNGKHVCEKCNWDQHAHKYSSMPIQ